MTTDYLKEVGESYRGFTISQVVGKDGHEFDLYVGMNADGVKVRAGAVDGVRELIDTYEAEHG